MPKRTGPAGPPTGYRKMIVEDTGCSAEESAEVEDVMRGLVGGTLDALTRGRFRKSARDAHAVAAELGKVSSKKA